MCHQRRLHDRLARALGLKRPWAAHERPGLDVAVLITVEQRGVEVGKVTLERGKDEEGLRTVSRAKLWQHDGGGSVDAVWWECSVGHRSVRAQPRLHI